MIAVCTLRLQCKTCISTVLAGALLALLFLLGMLHKVFEELEANEASDQATHPCTFTIELGRTLCCSPFIMLCNGLKISENKTH